MAGFTENTHLSVVLDRRKALTISSIDRTNSRQMQSPYKIISSPPSLAENGCTMVHWTQFANDSSSKTLVQLNGTSSTNRTQCLGGQGGVRRQPRLVLEDVLKTEDGRQYLRRTGCVQLSAVQSEKSRRDSQAPRRQPKPADRSCFDLYTRQTSLRRRSEDPQTRAVDSRRRHDDHQARTVDSRTRFEDPQPPGSPRSKNATSLKAKATDSDQPKLITSSRSDSVRSEKPKLISTPKSKPVPSEACRQVDTIKTRTPSRSQRSVEHVKTRLLKSVSDSPSGNPLSLDTPKPPPSIFGGRQIQVQVEVHAPPSSLRPFQTDTDPQNHADTPRPKHTDPRNQPNLSRFKATAACSSNQRGLDGSAPGSLRPGALSPSPPRGSAGLRGRPRTCEGSTPESTRRGSFIRTHQTRGAQDTRLGTSGAENTLPEEVTSRKRRGCENGFEGRREEESMNGVLLEEECVQRKSVLCLSRDSGGTAGGTEEPPDKCPRLTSLSEEQPANEERQSLIWTPLHAGQSEPIVLSSDEEGGEDDESCAQNGQSGGAATAEREGEEEEEEEEDGGEGEEDHEDSNGYDEEDTGVPGVSTASEEESTDAENGQYMHTLAEGPELNGVDMSHLPSVFELPFSALYMGGVKARANGKVEITEEKITFPLLDSSGESVIVVMAMSQLCTYSLLDSQELQSNGLVHQEDVPPPSLLLLFVSDDQAQQLHDDLSVIQPGIRPAESSACVCVYLHECVLRVEQALLASVMDLVGLRYDNHQLLSPLKPAESLRAIHTSGDTHLMELLAQERITHTHTHSPPPHAHTPQPEPETPTQPDTSTPTEPEPVYTLLHSRHQGRYSVQVAKPGPEWIPYKHHGPTRRLIQFPPPPCKGAITVTTEDLECLDSGQFLNDVIIDFYLKYLMAEKTPMDLADRCHVFSSFFYKQLTRRDNANEDCTSTTAEYRRHQRVKTWTRNVDIFSKDFVFVPVNQESHWYLVVVCYPGLEEARDEPFVGPAVVRGAGEESPSETQAEPQASEANPDAPASTEETTDPVEESNPTPPVSSYTTKNCTEATCTRPTVCKRPCILIMDSLKLSIHKRVIKLLREYLQVEWEVRRGESREFSPEVMPGSSCKVPLQDNSSDCGLYLLHYAETFLQDPVVHFDLPLRLERWFPRQQVRRKRDEIRNLVLCLCRFQSGMMGNVVPRGASAAQ